VGDAVEEDEDADEGRDLVPIPLLLTPCLLVDAPMNDCIERRRWLVPMVANIREQVMLIFSSHVAYASLNLSQLDESFRKGVSVLD